MNNILDRISSPLQYGGDSDFSEVANYFLSQQPSAEQEPEDYEEVQDVENNSINQDDYDNLSADHEALQQKYAELEEQLNEHYSNNSENGLDGDVDEVDMLNHLLENKEDTEPIDWADVNDSLDLISAHKAVVNELHSRLENNNNTASQQTSISNNQNNSTAAVRHNNPGNIKYGEFAKKYGATPGDVSTEKDKSRYAHFPTVEAGLKAQADLLNSKNYRNLSVEQAMNRWVTGDANKQGAYSKALSKLFDNKKIKDLTEAERVQLVKEQVKNEDRNMYNKLVAKQKGGAIATAVTPEEQYFGLNNPYLGVMRMPLEGKNVIRGLDNHQPVAVHDERGKYRVLTGPHDKETFFGNILEYKL